MQPGLSRTRANRTRPDSNRRLHPPNAALAFRAARPYKPGGGCPGPPGAVFPAVKGERKDERPKGLVTGGGLSPPPAVSSLCVVRTRGKRNRALAACPGSPPYCIYTIPSYLVGADAHIGPHLS